MSLKSKDLFYQMLRIRLVEEAIANRYSEQEMRCPTHLSIGQEANAVAVCDSLTHSDLAVSTHRAHAHYLAKGGSLKSLIAELYGKSDGCSSGKGGSMHLIDQSVGFMGSTAIVGGTIPLGAGLALSLQQQKKHDIACLFVGDGATEEGVFYETVNFAAVKKLPLLIVCENNLYSVYSPLSVRQPAGRKIVDMVKAIGISGFGYDGNDVMELHELCQQSIDSIRKGKGPQFIEISTYRWREHCGPNFDNHLPYRTEKEYQKWQDRDPVKYLQNSLLNSQQLNDKHLSKMLEEINSEINEAFIFAHNSPFPNKDKLDTDIYKNSVERDDIQWAEL